ncbi:YfhO family protein [Telluribacter sp. SYSU D00476]|uniref:YfhO family protein n=1 Tax=Telluribacter sp. SYSU D00476 TaxID=2811430 RepID=UPI001FF0ED39|nr:YfhO family protein [Telluribacter sp. SYSU D00476]
MKNIISWQRLWPHLVAVLGFALLSLMYASPVLNGKRLNQYDDIQARGAAQEVAQHHEKTGEWSAWTNSMFGGMPAYMIAGDYPGSLSTKLGRAVNSVLPAPANYFLLTMISAYILLLVLGANGWISAMGAVAYAFASYYTTSLEAGHVSKILALGYAPGVVAGVLLAFRKHWLSGAALTALFFSLELYANHLQITYYLGVGIVVLVIMESVALIKRGQSRQLVLTLGGLALAGLVAIGTHTTRLWNAYDYTKETIRGKSELSTPSATKPEPGQDGLDKEYAFQYSYGIFETFTLLIPNLYGGPSQGSLDVSSETYKTLVNRGVDAANAGNFVQALPLYWGGQYMTGGPAYAGAIIFFLFILGMFIVRSHLKWWILGVAFLYVIWAWGKNFAALNYFFFDYFPMFNKFRAVTMILNLVQLLLVMMAGLTLRDIAQKKLTATELTRPLTISVGITAGFCLLLALVPTLFLGFRGNNDPQFIDSLTQSTQNRAFAEEIMRAIVQDRTSMLRGDAFRSAIFILLAAGIIWLWSKEKIKAALVYPSLLILVIIDMFGVSKRYLNNDDFVSKQAAQSIFSPNPADQQILQDPDPNFRVLDVMRNTFNNAEASYYHKSIGGYHGAKLRRYQELIENQIAKQNANPGILNMLNTKYIITPGQEGTPVAQPNPDALGHAWFVDRYVLVPNADAEMKALDTIQPRRTAVLDNRFASQLQGLTIRSDSANSIRLTSYKPNELVYESNASSDQLAVFSEIYYNVRDEWKVTIDGQPAEMLRANYVLRALRVPAGKHTITFRFEPVSVSAGFTVELISSILLLALIGGAFYVNARRKEV